MSTYIVCHTYKGKTTCTVVRGTIIKEGLPPWAYGDSEGYSGLVNDLGLMASVGNLVGGISDKEVQQAIRGALQSALSVVQKRSEEQGFSVSESKKGQGPGA